MVDLEFQLQPQWVFFNHSLIRFPFTFVSKCHITSLLQAIIYPFSINQSFSSCLSAQKGNNKTSWILWTSDCYRTSTNLIFRCSELFSVDILMSGFLKSIWQRSNRHFHSSAEEKERKRGKKKEWWMHVITSERDNLCYCSVSELIHTYVRVARRSKSL